MSQFNLERFRFHKTAVQFPPNGSKSPESEKENKPAHMKPAKASSKSHTRGVVFEEVVVLSDEEDEPATKIVLSRHSRAPVEKLSKIVTNDDEEIEEKMSKLAEMFPQLSRQTLLEVVGSTSTLDGAVAACLLMPGYKDPDCGKKRKQDDSLSSQDITQPNKRRKSSVSEDECDDDDEEEDEPSWEKKESMVKKLQKKFPDQDKEELRMVLKEHDWNVDDALQVLQMFSDPGSTSSPDCTPQKSQQAKSSRDESQTKLHQLSGSDKSKSKIDAKKSKDLNDVNEFEGDSDATVDSDDFLEDQIIESKDELDNSMSTWISKDSSSSLTRTADFFNQKPSSSSSSAAQMLSRFASVTSIAQKQAVERKQKARASDERFSSDDEDSMSSDYDDSDEELKTSKPTGTVMDQVVQFFQEATIDELALISGCSVTKAKKIVALRPFENWTSLTELIHKSNGLQEGLLLGCKVVLKERAIVRRLMSSCETISSKMVKQVTAVMRSGLESMKQPSLLNSQLHLKPYQLIGLKWLLLLHDHDLSGILADEMGLGKTIQAIAFLAHLFENGIEGPHLITVPASTLDNWGRELKLWCPSLKVIVYCGSVEDRRYLKYDILNGELEFNVIVTTYNFVIGNDSDRGLFRKLRLKYAIFDEGHMLKNMKTLRYRHLMAVNAKHRLLLTGTPLQNNLLELMSLLNFIMPSLFSSSTTELSKMFSMKSHEEQSRFEKDRISQAKRIMKPFILRRVKNEVLRQLPAKEEKVEFCPMSEKQQVLYQSLLQKFKASAGSEKREFSNLIMQLRKMANHPLLHRQYYTTEKLKTMSKLMLKEPTHLEADAALIQEDMEVMSDFELHRLCQRYSSITSYQLENNLLLDSGKFHWLTERLVSLREKGDRVVLFSQFTMMLDIVEVLLKHLKQRYVRMDGSTPIADRIFLIDEFNTDSDIFIFLLSTRAGGLGINLTSANVVILHDIDWNPYNDKQAEDRCHRVGQTRTVKVIKMISKDSIEDGILQLGQKKLKLERDMTAAEQSDEGTIPEDMASLLKASLGL
ncbi:SWI/SNF-related matrix-associated actin-dependent regulator of chromatin subfamily A containing DEAD/H box 1A [Nerophis lumbriciformis]|uniref:SWI/SNF-related matrix-associated actin-dependent regulator of chromatin subfamily A containing DEAD/H box 1A n=1 Tax=Nerophis lumbriciformis TaxID=546530 RepID=UPI002ADF2F18|nr:SWI/SNF-related matrix-associated actin-dependent regulator of chromatin subfamily A containing DEAD/H box 1A-like [Nerophis lumbriciformis]